MSNQSFAQRLAEHRRISILRTLSSAPSYRCNESLLHNMLDEFGLSCSRDQVRSDVAWLRDQGLVSLDEVGGLFIVSITQAGQDVAGGRTTVPGVRRPSASG